MDHLRFAGEPEEVSLAVSFVCSETYHSEGFFSFGVDVVLKQFR